MPLGSSAWCNPRRWPSLLWGLGAEARAADNGRQVSPVIFPEAGGVGTCQLLLTAFCGKYFPQWAPPSATLWIQGPALQHTSCWRAGGAPLSAAPSRAGGERIQHVWVDVVKFMATSGSHKYIRAKYEVWLWPQRPQPQACSRVGLWASAGWKLLGCRHLVWESLLEDILSIKKKERNKNIKKYIKK